MNEYILYYSNCIYTINKDNDNLKPIYLFIYIQKKQFE